HFIVWPLSLMLLGLAGEAFAQTSTAAPEEAWPSPWPPAEPRPTTRQWYGGQVLIGYGASDLLLAAGAISVLKRDLHANSSFLLLAGTGLVVQVFAAPIIHWSHGHVGRGFLSLGLSAGLPMAGWNLGSWGGGPAMVYGFLTGMLIGRAIDLAVLSYDEVEEGSTGPGQRGAWAPSLTLAPIVGRDQTGLGVAGVF
ncbi:MAG TPA: hypothetical protein VE093_06305, partial [Polyangiaceae bacterium]|nr:hypothetical protein [Polyangiaceae bacterium]